MQVYINKNGQQLGAFEEAIVIEMLRNGQFSPNDYGIRQGENQWQTLGKMFPNAVNSFSPQPAFNPNPQQTFQPTPAVAKKSSKGLLIGVLAVGAILVLGIIGVAGLLMFGKSKNNTVYLTNTSNTNSSTSTPTPTPSYNFLTGKAAEFAKLSPPVKTLPKATLTGKTLIVEQWDKTNEYAVGIKGFKTSSFDEVDETELALYGLTKDRLPKTLDELETIVQIVCGKGGIVGKFGPRTAYVPAYANSCKISLIDYKSSKIYSQKIIQNAKKPATIYVRDDEYEYILPRPDEEVQKYVKGLAGV